MDSNLIILILISLKFIFVVPDNSDDKIIKEHLKKFNETKHDHQSTEDSTELSDYIMNELKKLNITDFTDQSFDETSFVS